MVAVGLGELIAYGNKEIIISALMILAVWCIAWTVADGSKVTLRRIMAGTIFVFAGYILMQGKILHFAQTEQKFKESGKSELNGVILDVRQSENGYVYTARINEEKYRVLLYSDEETEVYPGYEFETVADYMEYTGQRNQGNFNDREYYRSENIWARFKCRSFEITGDRHFNVRRKMYEIRNHINDILYRLYSDRHASVYSAMLLGNKSDMDEDVKELYKTAGIYHLVCISGTHMALIGMGVYGFLRRRHKYMFSGVCGIVAVIIYGVFTGMGVSVVRSVIMLSVRMAGDILGRTYDMISSLSLAAVIMMAVNPMVILNSGFIMSFGAVASIGMVLPEVKRFYSVGKGIKKAFVCSVVIQLCTLPAVSFFYYQVSVYGVFINIVLVPCMVYVLSSGFLSISAYGMVPAAGRFAAGTGSMCLGIYDKICESVSALPASEYVTGRPQVWKIALYYCIMIVLLAAYRRFKNKDREFWEEFWYIRYGKIIMSITAVVAACVIIFAGGDSGLTVRYIDVGQGDSIYVQTDGAAYLIDGGSSDIKNVGTYRILPVLKANGLNRLDYIIVTHSDNDHINGLENILNERIGSRTFVKNLVMPDIGDKDEAYIKLVNTAESNGINVMYIKSGDKWITGGCTFECIYPAAGDNAPDKNDMSVVMKLTSDNMAMLFTGDLGEKGEDKLKGKIGKCNVLKVGHHGSKGSSGDEFLNELQPDIAVISAGINNSYGHPHRETLERLKRTGSKIYSTAKMGQITVTGKPEGMEVDYYIK